MRTGVRFPPAPPSMGLHGFDLVAMFRGQSGNVKAVRVGRFLAVEAKPITANDDVYGAVAQAA